MPFQDMMKKCHLCGQFQEEGWGAFFSVLQVLPTSEAVVDTVVTRKWICNAFAHSCSNQLLQVFIADELGIEVSIAYTIEQIINLPIPQALQSVLIANAENWIDSAVRDCNESESVHLWLPRFELKSRHAKVLQQIRQLHEELESVLLIQCSVPFSKSDQATNELFNEKIKKRLNSLTSLISARNR